MVKRGFWYFMAALTVLSVLLCGCGDESRGDVMLIGSAGTDARQEEEGAAPPEAGMPCQAGSAQMPEASGNPQPEQSMMRVYVCGAVVCPGVVEIPQGSRVEDALLAAGGFLPDALTEAVNLAGWTVDGQMLYFPTKEEAEAWIPVQENRSGQDEQGKLVNINTAGAALLCTLPGIGEAKAADIIAYREAHGGFTCCEDIMKVPGIKTNIYEKLCDKITVKQ